MNPSEKQHLLKIVPEAMPVTREWLLRPGAGLDRHAVDNLVKSGQLSSIARGVYVRPGATLTWEGVVCSLQNVLKTDLTVGGVTALELQGFGHYVALSGKRAVHLYGKDRLPGWAKGLVVGVEFDRHSLRGLFDGLQGQEPAGLVNDKYDAGMKKLYGQESLAGSWPPDLEGGRLWPFRRSTPERAVLEVLAGVPDAVSFEYADQLFEGLTTLSPRRLEQLLKGTANVKVRRLFYWFAERHRHAWFKKLPDPRKIDSLGLGSGKRTLAKGGKLDGKYEITVPEEMWRKTTGDKYDY